MKSSRRISLLLVIIMLASLLLSSCSKVGDTTDDPKDDPNKNPITVVNTFELKAPKTTVTRGEEVTLSAVLKKDDGTETAVTTAEYFFVEGADYASLSGNVLTVNNNAPDGAIIQVKARDGATDSNAVTLVVKVDLTVNSITIEALGSNEIVKGGTVGLHAEVDPATAASLITWTITEGGDYAQIKGSTLMVSANAETGNTIKVIASYGNVTSNELTFTVTATSQEIGATKHYINVSNTTIRLDKKGSTSPVLTVEVYDGNFEKVEDLANLTFTVIDGEEFVSVKKDGNVCTFEALGHGQAEVEVRFKEATAKVHVDVIVPPDTILLPEIFTERPTTDITKFNYAFSLVDPFTGNTEKLPFNPIVKGSELACTELTYTFTHADGTTGDDVAVYENGAITFKKTGIVTVTVSSNSGSRVEATASYKFDINEGYNVNTFEELSYVIERNNNGKYNGEIINFVVLEKPVNNTGSDYKYGYDLVPSLALNTAVANQSFVDIATAYTTYNGVNVNLRIQAVNTSLYINGNNHTIDVSQIRIFHLNEYNKYIDDNDLNPSSILDNLSSLLSAEAYSAGGVGSDPTVDGQTYMVNLYNINLKGNTGINYNSLAYGSSNQAVKGGYDMGLSIGSREYDVHYYIDANNLTASGFAKCLNFTGIVGNGKITNLNVYDCFGTGIVIRSSIVTVENVKLGACGATGIEMAPEECNEAGINDNENSKITISGTMDAHTNLNNMQTNYYNSYTIMGTPVSMIVAGNMQLYGDNQVSHIRNANGEYIFVSLLFFNSVELTPNTSIVEYPAYQKGGIIDITQLPDDGVNTTHQFIKLDIHVDIPALGGDTVVGTAYFYNLNYVDSAAVTE